MAQLANRLGGTVHETSFKDVNEARIYPFTIVAPRPIGMPMVVDYLKETAETNVAASTDPIPTSRVSAAPSSNQ